MKKLLIVSYWIGIIADAVAALLPFSPAMANVLLQPKRQEKETDHDAKEVR